MARKRLDDFANNHKQYCIARWQELRTENRAKEAEHQVKEREENVFPEAKTKLLFNHFPDRLLELHCPRGYSPTTSPLDSRNAPPPSTHRDASVVGVKSPNPMVVRVTMQK